MGAQAKTTSTTARKSSKNGNSCFCDNFAVIQSDYAFKMFSNYPGINWNQRSRNKTIKLNICHHMLSSSTQLQNRAFYVIERTRTSAKCEKMKKARAKRAKLLFLVVKYANLGLFRYRRRRGCLRSLIGFCN